MNSIYIVIGTIFTAAFVAQMYSYATFSMRRKVEVGTSRTHHS